MLIQATLENLRSLNLKGMAEALESQLNMPDALSLGFEERLGILVDAEITTKETSRLRSRLKSARLRQNASIEDIDWKSRRDLDRSVFATLATLQWIKYRRNLLILGPTGIGKTFLASALAQKACRDGLTVFCERAIILFKQLAEAKIAGNYDRTIAAIAKKDLLIIDDFGLKPLNEEARLELLEIMENRYEKSSTLVTSQLPIEHWHDTIGDPTVADAILDRLVHNAHTLTLKGDSMRKAKGKKDLETMESIPA